MKPDGVAIVGFLMLLIGVYVLWRAHKSKKQKNIDMADLLVDHAVIPPRMTLAKFTGLGGWLVATWWLSYITFSGKFDATAFAAYLAYCGAVKIAGDFAPTNRESKE